MSTRVWKIITAVLVILFVAMAVLAINSACTGTLELASGSDVAMKCNWTARVACMLAATGAVMAIVCIFLKSNEAKRAGTIATAFFAVDVLLVETYVIGVCANAAMRCVGNSRIILIIAVLTLVVSLILLAKPGASLENKPKKGL